jgi:hypothetical protein
MARDDARKPPAKESAYPEGVPIAFVRTGKKQNWMHATRSDGRAVAFPWPAHPGPPHDLVHLVVERAFGLRHAFWGLLAEGVDFAVLNTAAERARTGERVRDLAGRDLRELYLAEALVACFTNELVWTGERTPAERRAAVAEACARWGVPVPDAFGDALTADVLRELAGLWDRWERLPPGGRLELPDFPPASAPVAP